jgi:hypothetical protein
MDGHVGVAVCHFVLDDIIGSNKQLSHTYYNEPLSSRQ